MCPKYNGIVNTNAQMNNTINYYKIGEITIK